MGHGRTSRSRSATRSRGSSRTRRRPTTCSPRRATPPTRRGRTFKSPIGMPAPPESLHVQRRGRPTRYVCIVHRATMIGVVRVGSRRPAAAAAAERAAVRQRRRHRRWRSRRSPGQDQAEGLLRCRPSAAPSAARCAVRFRGQRAVRRAACASSAAARSSRPLAARRHRLPAFTDLTALKAGRYTRRGAGDRRRRQPLARSRRPASPSARQGPLGSRRSRSDRRLRSPRSAGAGRGSAHGRRRR